MRWNCPHCGIALAVTDEKLSSSWTFSRCYKCGGFALVRKTDVNLVKVDHAPIGEKVILPEGSETPTLSSTAMKNLAGFVSNGGQPKPTILPARRRPITPNKATTPPPFQGRAIPMLPPPLPRVDDEKGIAQKILPLAMALMSVVAMSSGFYLFKQGQNLYRRSVEPPTTAKVAQAIKPVVSGERLIEIDQVRASAQAAPTRSATPATTATPEQDPAPLPGLVIRPRSAMVMLRSGPGTSYKELGYANPSLQYVVMEWKERWFKVLIQDSRQTAWVRNDLVTLTPITAAND